MTSITQLTEWQALAHHQKEIATIHMKDWFLKNPGRFSDFSLEYGDLLFDYSKNRIVPKTLELLNKLSDAVKLPEKINDFLLGRYINVTENRPALHTALRHPIDIPILVNNKNIMPDIGCVLDKMKNFSDKIRNHTWLGCTGQPIKYIVNIGIGGSHLGPLMTTYALAEYADPSITCFFISNIDSAHIREVLRKIEPEKTLFIISSKSFTTLETLTNAKTIRKWWSEKLGAYDLNKHFVAVTACPQKAIEFGIPAENVFLIWDWVGGRYSVWSAIGLPLAIAVGMDNFLKFLEGGYSIDQHLKQNDFSKNIPVIMGLLSIWYINFFDSMSSACIPYSHYLHYFRVHLQQLEMESNGKFISHRGTEVDHATGAIIWGDQGCNGQHAFYQLLHQGKHIVPIDFILVGTDTTQNDHHDILVASGLSQAQALMMGKTFEEAYNELITEGYKKEEALYLASHKVIPGNRPSNVFFMKKITPYNLGALLALYEHKTFVQGVIWNINSFDQWGVELGKQLLPNILQDLKALSVKNYYDCSTQGLISFYKKTKDYTS